MNCLLFAKMDQVFSKENKTLKKYWTRMHSSRMRTARTLTGGGGDCKRQKKKMTQTPYTVCELY